MIQVTGCAQNSRLTSYAALLAKATAFCNQPLPPNVTIIDGDLLFASEDIIGHQCNCVTKKGKGLADILFQQLPWADVYADRRSGVVKAHAPGTTILRDDGITKKRIIANMFAQYKGGSPKGHHNDTAMQRVVWFRQSLAAIAAQAPPTARSLALPFNIGCGLAGGVWDIYLMEIALFALQNPSWKITIYRLPGSAALEEGDNAEDSA